MASATTGLHFDFLIRFAFDENDVIPNIATVMLWLLGLATMPSPEKSVEENLDETQSRFEPTNLYKSIYKLGALARSSKHAV